MKGGDSTGTNKLNRGVRKGRNSNKSRGSQKSKSQEGGDDRNDKRDVEDKYIIPEYREPRNNPMIPKEQKKIFAQNVADRPKYTPKAEEPMLNLQLYQQKPKPRPKPESYPHPAVFYPNYTPNPFNPVEYANFMNATRYGQFGGPVGGPVFKEYNINIGGVAGSHVKTSMLFEDALPVKNIQASFSSMGERNTVYEYIRSIMFSKGDGEDLPIEDSNYNLLSHLKFMDMNPYNASRFFNNPYRGLPYGFLLFRSCYPIRHDERTASAICARNSTGINVRIYRMTEGAHQVNRNAQKMEQHDLWREMAFYDYIKDQIVKSKICPNFTIMYGYNITLNSQIDFESINSIDKTKGYHDDYMRHSQMTSGLSRNPSSITAAKIDDDRRRENEKLRKGQIMTFPAAPGEHGYPLASQSRDPRYSRTFVPIDSGIIRLDRNAERELVEETQRQVENEMNMYRGKALVCLTEASNYSLLGWAHKEYRSEGNVKRMINTGYHPCHVWNSVLFQLMAALYTMQRKGIIIRNFKLGRNVFVKDIESHSKATSYWKYKIDGVDYYVPNYGYLVLIDTNYRDFDDDVSCEKETDPDRDRKLDGNFVNTSMSGAEITDMVFDSFRSVIDPNVFDQDFVNDDGIKPPEEVLRLMSNIKSDADSTTSGKSNKFISEYIRRYMTMFLHNRVGTLLTVTEVENVKRGATKEFRDGELVVMPDSAGKERFVIHVRTDPDKRVSRIITRDRLDDKANIIEKDVPESSLIKYSTVPSDAPMQTFDNNALNTEPAETYVIA